MPDLALELKHLREAEEHVADGERLVARLELMVERARQNGADTTTPERTLDAMHSTLATFY